MLLSECWVLGRQMADPLCNGSTGILKIKAILNGILYGSTSFKLPSYFLYKKKKLLLGLWCSAKNVLLLKLLISFQWRKISSQGFSQNVRNKQPSKSIKVDQTWTYCIVCTGDIKETWTLLFMIFLCLIIFIWCGNRTVPVSIVCIK